MRKYAIIVAGGEGTRAGGALPKQFQDISGRPMLWWTMKAFADEDPSVKIIVVMNPRCVDLWRDLFFGLPANEQISHEIAMGGASRTESVENGLMAVTPSADSYVAIHDAARPLVDRATLRNGWLTAMQTGGVVPVVPVSDSLRQLTPDGTRAVDRSEFVAVQTPQVFRADLIKNAYQMRNGRIYSDDAAAYEAAGGKVATFPGNPQNFKVTNPGDIERAALFLNA